MNYSYYHYYNCSVEELVEKLNIEELEKWEEYNCDNDVVLLHLMLEVAKNRGIYTKAELKSHIYNLLYKTKGDKIREVEKKIEEDIISTLIPRINYNYDGRKYYLEKLNESDRIRNSYNKLFDKLWESRYSFREGRKEKALKKVIYSYRPTLNKLYNSNISIIVFAILFLILQHNIRVATLGDLSDVLHVPILRVSVVTTLISYVVIVLISRGVEAKCKHWQILFVPILTMGLVGFGWAFLYFMSGFMHIESWQISMTNKVYENEILTFLLWYAILPCNIQRLEDCHGGCY